LTFGYDTPARPHAFEAYKSASASAAISPISQSLSALHEYSGALREWISG